MPASVTPWATSQSRKGEQLVGGGPERVDLLRSLA